MVNDLALFLRLQYMLAELITKINGENKWESYSKEYVSPIRIASARMKCIQLLYL